MYLGNLALFLLVLLGPMLFLWIASSISNELSSTLEQVIFPFSWDLNGTEPVLLGKMPVCKEESYYCSPSFYYTPMDPYHSAIIKQFAQLAGYSESVMVGFPSQSELVDTYYSKNRHLSRRPRHYIIQFSTFSDLPTPPTTFSSAFTQLNVLQGTWYTLGEGRSNIIRSGFDPLLTRDYSVAKSTLLTVSYLLNKAILQIRSNLSLSLDVSLAALPRFTQGLVPMYRQSQADAEAMKLLLHYASNLLTVCLITMGGFPLLLLILQLIAQDKYDGMLTRLRHMNLSESAYWFSIFLLVIGLSALASSFALIPAQLLSFHVIQAIPPSVYFLLYWMFMISFTLTGCFAVTLSSSHYTSGVLTVLYMVMCSLSLFVLPLIDLNQFYTKATLVPWWSVLPTYANYLLAIFPFIHFSRSFSYLIDLGRNVPSLTWSDALAPSSTVTSVPWILSFTFISQTLLVFFSLVGLWYTFQVFGKHAKPWTLVSRFPAPTSSTTIELNHVYQRFGRTEILHDIHMCLKKGTATALLGHNGSGKSTLIDILSGTEPPYQGTAHLLGDPVGTTEAKHRLGVCPQNDVYYPSLTALDHMQLWCRLKGIPEEKLPIYMDTLLSAVSLNGQDVKKLSLQFYSGGMKRRLSLISACIGAPDLIILDEPTNGLDPIHRRHVWEFVASLKTHSVLLLTSHSTLEVDALAEDVIVLSEGRVVLNRNLMELRHEHAIELQVTLTDEDAMEDLTCPILSKKILKSKEVLIKVDRVHFPELCMFLDSPFVLDWKIHSSLESFLPPQPGTEVFPDDPNGDAYKLGGSSSSLLNPNTHTPNEFTTPPIKNPGFQPRFIQILHQVTGLLIKNLKTQMVQVRYNIVFMCLFIGILLALNFLSKSANEGICLNGGHLPLIDPLNPESPRTCDIETYSNLTRIGLGICRPNATTLCPIPDYAVIKQLAYQNQPVPRIWMSAPPNLRSIVSAQSTASISQSKDENEEYYFRLLGLPKPTSSDWAIRPRQLIFSDQPLEEWIENIKNKQIQLSWNVSNQTLPSSCFAIAEQKSASLWVDSVIQAEQNMSTWLPDFAVRFSNLTSIPNKDGAMHAKIDLRYWTMSAYPFATYFFSYPYLNAINEQCKSIGVNPTSFLNARIISERAPTTFVPEQSVLPSYLIQDKKNQLESLYLLDSPIRHMLTSAMTTLARALINPSETLFVDYMAVFDLEYSLRTELMMNAMIGVLIWIFFSMFIFIPMSEQGKLIGFYRVNGMSMPAYWASQYMYCFIYSIPFMFALGLTLAVIQPQIHIGHLILIIILSMHSVIGLSFFYASVAVNLGFSSIATFLSYLAPILIAIPSSIYVYSDVISLPIQTTFFHLAFPGLAIAFAFRQLIQNFDLVYLNSAYMWLTVVGSVAYFICILLNIWRDIWYKKATETKKKSPTESIRQKGNPPVMPRSSPKLDINPDSSLSTFNTASFTSINRRSKVTTTSSTTPFSSTTTTSSSSPSSPSTSSSTTLPTSNPTNPYPPLPGFTPLILSAKHGSTTLSRHPTIPENAVLEPVSINDVRLIPTHRRGNSSSSSMMTPDPRSKSSGRTHHRGLSSTSVLTTDSHVAREAAKVKNPEEPFVVKLDQICKQYSAEEVILENLSFMIEPHESFGLLGANGCGKSHTVKIITGQMQPTSGAVQAPPSFLLGVCPQENFLLETLTVHDNFRFYAHLKGFSYLASIQASQFAAKLVGLTPFLDRKIHQLSGGMKRRVSLGIALLGRPTMLIADEPTTALDVHHQLNLWRILTRLQKEQDLALLLVSHDMDEISYLCQRIGILKKSLVCVGSAHELKRKYGHQWRLLVQCTRDQTETIRRWIDKLGENVMETTLTDATPFFAEKMKLEFSIPKSQTSLFNLAQIMTKEAASVGIREWSIEPWSLEDVFVRVVLGKFRGV
ncbi:hypothetical protein HMI55_003265 [Coelomomyces lativittatus]|nr:hypothetical protein HMI55_003265 [Coelomomyces lativittatus]